MNVTTPQRSRRKYWLGVGMMCLAGIGALLIIQEISPAEDNPYGESSELQDAYVQILREEYTDLFAGFSDEQVKDSGRRMCDQLDAGKSPQAAMRDMSIDWMPLPPPVAAYAFGAAQVAFCPHHAELP